MQIFNRIITAILTPVRAIGVLIARIVPGLKRVPGISVPLRYALAVCVLLVIVYAMSWWYYWRNKNFLNVPPLFDEWWGWLLALLLLATITTCVYLAVDLLRKAGPVSPHPDVFRAWEAGIEAAEKAGIDFRYTPLFLVLGTGDETAAGNLHEAAATKLTLQGVPGGTAPLQWFGNQQALFVHVCDACCLSKLVNSPAVDGSQDPVSSGQPATGHYTQTVGPAARPPAAASQDPRKTVVAGGPSGDTERVPVPGGPAPGAPVRAGTQTIRVAPASALAVAEDADQGFEISDDSIDEQVARLAYVCRLFRDHRQPICPLNGVLAVTPFRAIETSSGQVQVALKQDLQAIESNCQLQCPLTLLVSDIEKEPGFLEFMRRMDRKDVEAGRIGSRYGNSGTDIWTPANRDRINAMAASARRNIEDNILGFFGREDALTRRGNGQLFSLLSKLRGTFGRNFGSLWDGCLAETCCLLVGCYFVASGESEDRRGFVSGVMNEKIVPSRDKLSWLPAVIRRDEKYRLVSGLFALVTLVSVVCLALMIWKPEWFDWFGA
jgi:hypothetical protein